jgi:small subunit ribosomal protein S4
MKSKGSKAKKCDVCRRTGEKLFLKGDKCYSPKCIFLRKPFPPGQTPKRRRQGTLSEYGRERQESQKIRNVYIVSEKQFKKIINEVLKRIGKEDVSQLLVKRLEKRISNVIYRCGLSTSRKTANQLVSHGHFLLNGKSIDIPSIEVKKGDEITLKEKAKKNTYFQRVLPELKKEDVAPTWLKFNKEKIVIKVVSDPETEDVQAKINIPLILSFYSR